MSKTTAVAMLDQPSVRDRLLNAMPLAEKQRERLLQVCVAVAKDASLAQCEPGSVVMAIYGAARLGLVPDPTLGHVYVLPRRVKGQQVAQLQVGYRGYVELARRSGLIRDLHAEVVYSNDLYRVQLGTRRSIHHVPWDQADQEIPGLIVGAYVTWTEHQCAEPQFHRITMERVARAKEASQTAGRGFSPWDTDEAAMIRKTAILDAAKLWPLSPELASATHWDEAAERGDTQQIAAGDNNAQAVQVQLPLTDDDDDGLDYGIVEEPSVDPRDEDSEAVGEAEPAEQSDTF